MAITVTARQLKKGCRCEVIADGSKVPVLARILKVRDHGDRIEIEVKTKHPMRLPGMIYASSFHTIIADPNDPVRVSHLPSESPADTRGAHERGQSPAAKAG